MLTRVSLSRDALALCLMLAGCVGCSSASAPSGAPADAAAPLAPAADASQDVEVAPPSPGCGLVPPATGLLPKLTLEVGGKRRELFVSLPSSYDPRAARGYPVVFVFHGATDTHPETQRDWFAVEKNAPPAVFVYPQALVRTRADGTGGAVTRWDLEGDEDLRFVDAILQELGRTYCVRPGDGFATGFSSGGNFAQQLGCKRRSAIRAIGAVSGPGPFSDTCDGPLAVWMTHDAEDSSLPVAGARASRDFWTKQNGCQRGQLVQEPQAECKRAVGCPDDAPVVYCESTKVGHAVASYAPRAVAEFFAPLMR